MILTRYLVLKMKVRYSKASRYATWSQSFTSYAKEHTVGISEEIWENLHFYQTTAFTSDDLYETYDRYFVIVIDDKIIFSITKASIHACQAHMMLAL